MIIGFLGPIGTAIGWVWDNTAGRAVDAATESAQNWVIGGVVDAITWFAQVVDDAINASTRPVLSADWFTQNYNAIFAIGLVMVVATFVVQILAALVRREPQALGRALSGALIATMGGFAVLGIATTLLELVDALSRDIMRLSSGDMEVGLEKLLTVAMAHAAATGGWFLVLFLFGLLVGAALLMLWLVLTIRMVAIYVVAVFAPVAFAGWGWEKTRSWLTRWSQMLAALIFCKLVMYVIFSLAWSMLSGQVSEVETQLAEMDGPPTTEVMIVNTTAGEQAVEVEAQRSPGAGVTLALGGVAMLVLACGSPWATYRFLSWASDAGGAASDLGAPRGAIAGPAVGMAAAGAAVGGRAAMMVGSAGVGAARAGAGAAAGAGGTASAAGRGAAAIGAPAGVGASNGRGGGVPNTPGGSAGAAVPTGGAAAPPSPASPSENDGSPSGPRSSSSASRSSNVGARGDDPVSDRPGAAADPVTDRPAPDSTAASATGPVDAEEK